LNLPAEIFRAYDIRGIAGRTLTPEIVRAIGRALGAMAPRFAIGRDGRHSGPLLADALAQGMNEAGADVIDIGMAPTPVTYFAAHHLGCGSCVSVTGSHNPPDYNGLKMVVDGHTLSGEEIQAVRRKAEAAPAPRAPGRRSGASVLDAYVERIVGDVRLARPMRIAVDCGNGVAGMIAPRLFRALGCEVEELYCDVDGDFPNHHPDPSHLENLVDLIARVKAGGSELGFAFDGDGDRLGVVTRDG